MLFRVLLRAPFPLTEPRVCHGANVSPCPRHEGLPCHCPWVRGEIKEVWRNAPDAIAAQAAVEAKYPGCNVQRIIPGLLDELNRRPPRGAGLAFARSHV